MNKFKTVIVVQPVSWTGDKVNKYQATATVSNHSNEVVKRIQGDPKPNEALAKQSLLEELRIWRDVAIEAYADVSDILTEEAKAEAAIKESK